MSKSLAKYHARSPRYILQPIDEQLIRIAGPLQTPWEEGTEIQNISLTGLAFTAAPDLCPIVGEFIKIEFSVPNSKKMACNALVVRLEKLTEKKMILVGVKFIKLDVAHRIVLAQNLAKKLKNQQTREYDFEINKNDLFSKRKAKAWSYSVLMMLVLFGMMYFFA